MKRGYLFGAVVLAGLLVLTGVMRPPSRAEAASDAQAERIIQVTGEGEVKAPPDLAVLEVAVETTGDTARVAQEANARDMLRVISALKKQGVGEKDIQTSQLSLYPLYESPPKEPQPAPQPPKVIGFKAVNSLQVTVRNLDTLGQVLDAVVASGANRVQGISFGFADPAPLQDQALQKAVGNARHQAELVAQAAGVRIKGVRSISIYGGGAVPLIRKAAFAEEVGAGYGGPPPVLPGEASVRASVSMIFEIE